MKRLTAPCFLPAVIAVLASMLCSCANPDPKFVENSSRIQNINYPASKIVGTWADFYISTVQSASLDSEGKVYYEFRSNGRGTMRQASKNTSTGESMTIEGDFRWKYLGHNQWTMDLPASTEYRVTATNNMHMGYRAALTLSIRYYDDELYVTPGSHVWVRADREHVAELAQRIRNAPAVRLGVQQ